MTLNEFRELYEATPFRRFTIHLADGREVLVRHREFALPSPNGRTVMVYQPDNSFDVIDLFLVTSLRVKDNGKKSASRNKG